MSLPVSEAITDAIRDGKYMNRDEGKVSTVALIHPSLADKWYAELGMERPRATEDFDPAPEIARHRIIEDASVDVDEVCVLSDDDYMEHEYLKLIHG